MVRPSSTAKPLGSRNTDHTDQAPPRPRPSRDSLLFAENQATPLNQDQTRLQETFAQNILQATASKPTRQEAINLLSSFLSDQEEENEDQSVIELRRIIKNLSELNATEAKETEESFLFSHFVHLARITDLMINERDTLFQANEINKAKVEQLWALNRSEPSLLHESIERNNELQAELKKAKGDQEKDKKRYEHMKEAAKDYRRERDEEKKRVAAADDALEALTHEKEELLAELEEGRRGRPRSKAAPLDRQSSFSRSASAKRYPEEQGRRRSNQEQRLRFEDSPIPSQEQRREGTHATQDTAKTSGTLNIDPRATKAFSTDKGIPNPSKFTGTEKHAFYPWLGSVELKLKNTTFREHTDALEYVLSFLSDQAWALCAPRVQSSFGRPCANPYRTVSELIKHLVDRYGDINTKSQARTTFQHLKQGTDESFEDFFTKFQGCTAFLTLDDDDEAFELRQKLNGRYGQKINDGSDYQTLAEVVKRARNLEDTFRANDARTKNDAPHRSKDKDKDKTNYGGSRTTTTTKSNPGDSKGDSFPAKYRNLKPLNDEEREQLRKEGKCLRCRETGHMQFEKDKCPLGRFSYRQVASNALTTTTDHSQTASEEGKARVTS